eukprot:1157281-Pelagomonas_calceolata.AAC.4
MVSSCTLPSAQRTCSMRSSMRQSRRKGLLMSTFMYIIPSSWSAVRKPSCFASCKNCRKGLNTFSWVACRKPAHAAPSLENMCPVRLPSTTSTPGAVAPAAAGELARGSVGRDGGAFAASLGVCCSKTCRGRVCNHCAVGDSSG